MTTALNFYLFGRKKIKRINFLIGLNWSKLKVILNLELGHIYSNDGLLKLRQLRVMFADLHCNNSSIKTLLLDFRFRLDLHISSEVILLQSIQQ